MPPIKRIRPNFPKHILQLGILGIILFLTIHAYISPSYYVDFEAYCPFGGIQAGISFLTRGSLACSMTSTQIFMGGMLIVGIILFSKLFCAFVCPIGTISEWLGKLGDKFNVRYTIIGIPDMLLRSLKYVLLFLTFYHTLKSSELFCKKFDPYYAATNGFGYDVNTLWAIIAISVVVFGSIFFRLFWCKYLCPLSALSNIFKYFLVTFFVIVIYVTLLYFDFRIGFEGPLAVICIVCFLIEFWSRKSIIIPLHKVTRNTENCINCMKCNLECPQAINVAEMKTVDHIDCNLCGDCLTVCPAPNALNINNKNWLNRMPAILTVLLIIFGFTFSNHFEVPTIEEHWGTPKQMKNTAILTRSGLKDIKCYGSSKSFANNLRLINGVYGVSTYVKTKTVKIYYDPLKTDERKIMHSIFKPISHLINYPKQTIQEIVQVDLLIENFFDIYDTRNLSNLLKTDSDILGIASEYGCPVKVSVFLQVEEGDNVDIDKLKKLVETKEFHHIIDETRKIHKLNFEVVNIEVAEKTLSKGKFLSMMFKKYRNIFPSFYRANKDHICSFEFPFPNGDKPEMGKWLPYLASHLSYNSGILGFETIFKDQISWGRVFYNQDLISEEDILILLKQDSLRVRLRGGTDKYYKNPFNIDLPKDDLKEAVNK